MTPEEKQKLESFCRANMTDYGWIDMLHIKEYLDAMPISAQPEESEEIGWGYQCPNCAHHITLPDHPFEKLPVAKMWDEIAKRKIEEAMKAKGYDNPSQMPVKEVLDYLDQGGE